MTINWEKNHIVARGDDGSFYLVEEAEILGYLAVFPMWWDGDYSEEGYKILLFERKSLFPEAWAICHLPTQVIAAFSLSPDDARRFCEQASELGDFWNFCYGYCPTYPNKLDKETCMQQYKAFYSQPEVRKLLY